MLQQAGSPLTAAREDVKLVHRQHASLVTALRAMEEGAIEKWGAGMQAATQAKLKLPLLLRNRATGLLKVNFDPALVQLLREVKYFLLLRLQVPDAALQVFRKGEVFRQQTGRLHMVVDMYNHMMRHMLPVEAPLVTVHLKKIDQTLSRGLTAMNWKSIGIDDFITSAVDAVSTADELLKTMSANLAETQALLAAWSDEPLLSRPAKPVTFEEFEAENEATLAARYSAVRDGGKRIAALMKETLQKLKVSAGLPDWRAYLDFVNGIVIEGTSAMVVRSLHWLGVEK